jgi:DNA topoisomerase VI subunit B
MLRELDEGGTYWIPVGRKLKEAILEGLYETKTEVPNLDPTEYRFITIDDGEVKHIENVHVDFQAVDKDRVTARKYMIMIQEAVKRYDRYLQLVLDRRAKFKRAIRRSLTLKQRVRLIFKKICKKS